MYVCVPGERLGVEPDLEEMGEEDFVITNPALHVERNKRNPTGFVFTIEDGENTHSIRITTDRMKIILKEVIGDL